MLKQSLCYSAVLVGTVLSSMAHAGGPDLMAPPVAASAPAAPAERGIYADVGLGYAMTDWEKAYPDLGIDFISGKTGGFAYGGDLGYQFNHLFSVEGGFYKLPDLKIGIPYSYEYDTLLTSTISSHLFYAAGKLSVPFFVNNLKLYGKLGIGWRELQYRASEKRSVSYSSVIAGAGLQYYMTDSVSAGVQYLMMPRRLSHNDLAGETRSPAVHLLLANIGYRFNL